VFHGLGVPSAQGIQVLDLANRLRGAGVDVSIYQYENAPPVGWVRWMRGEIERADFVLVICTQIYQRRAEGKEEPGKGLGANREGLIIDQEIYDHNGKNEKFIALLLRSSDSPFAPEFLTSGNQLRKTTVMKPSIGG
jgi:hypothetical protein